MGKPIHQGDIIILLNDIASAKAGDLAYVYEHYQLEGANQVSVITSKAVDLPRFDEGDQRLYFRYVRHSDYIYDYRGSNQLYWDFPELIKPLFEDIRSVLADPDVLVDKKY